MRGTYESHGGLLPPAADSSSTSPLLVLEISGTLTFTGGTGRFTGAIGTENMHGRQSIDVSQADLPAHTVLDLEGTITLTYPAH
jgi:hypothetical protein